MATTIPMPEVLRVGDTSTPRPFKILVLANPVLLDQATNSLLRDPIIGNRVAYDECVRYIHDSLFGLLPGQRERLLAAPDIEPKVRFVSFFAGGLPVAAENALVANRRFTDVLEGRRTALGPFLARFGLGTDVVYAVSGSTTHSRATTWWAEDDIASGGVPFLLDGQARRHCFLSRIPGMVSIHVNARSLVALHEFSHALGSYQNGGLRDLYLDSLPEVNCKRGRPIPNVFATYNGVAMRSDPLRDGLGYEPGWESFHCELLNPAAPAVMDHYDAVPDPLECAHDRITRQFLHDRLRAKISR